MQNQELGDSLPNSRGANTGRVVSVLAEMPAQSLLDERALAVTLGVTMRTIRRMVRRNELPPPVSFAGRATWMAASVLAHFAQRAERAAREAEREAQRLAALGMGSAGKRTDRKRREGIESIAVEDPDGKGETRPAI